MKCSKTASSSHLQDTVSNPSTKETLLEPVVIQLNSRRVSTGSFVASPTCLKPVMKAWIVQCASTERIQTETALRLAEVRLHTQHSRVALSSTGLFICLSSSLHAELVIPATGNVFYAMTSSSVDFLLRKKGGNTPLGSQPINTETSATFPRIKAKGRRLVRNLFWQKRSVHFTHSDRFFLSLCHDC